MIEAMEFPDLANRFHVSGVPQTTINSGSGTIVGSGPEEELVNEIKRVLETYRTQGENMDAKVVWKSGLGFDGTADSGFTLPMGGYNEIGSENAGFRPVELLAIGLAGCTAMDVISILEKKCLEVTAFEVISSRITCRRASQGIHSS